MNVEKWRILVNAVDSGSMAAVAAQTNYTTSGVSRIITTLEEEIGFPLLVRHHRGVTPTNECRLLLPDVRAFLHAEEKLKQQVAQLNGLEIGSLTIGTAYSSSYPLLTKQVVKFVERYPNIKVSVLWGYNRELRQAVVERRIDLCLVSRGDELLDWMPFRKDRMMVLVGEGHPLAGEKMFPIEALATEPYIDICSNQETDANQILARFGVEPNTKFTTSDRYAAHEMVRAGLGVTLVNETQILPERQGIRAIPLAPAQMVEIGLACLPQATLATRRFIRFWKEGS